VDLRLGVAGAGRSAAKEAPEVSMCHIEEHRGFAALQPRPPRRTRRMGLKGCLLPALHLGSSIRTSRMASQRMLKSTPLGFMPMERGFDDCDTFSLTNFLLHRCKAGWGQSTRVHGTCQIPNSDEFGYWDMVYCACAGCSELPNRSIACGRTGIPPSSHDWALYSI